MRPLVIPPAQVHAHLLGRDVLEGVIERFDVESRHLPKLLEALVGELDVPAHGEVGAVDLQDEPGPRDRLVLVAHGVRDSEQVGLVTAVVVVAEEERDDAG